MNEPIKTVCASCGVVLREGRLIEGRFVSHGSCRVCALYTINQLDIDTFEGGLNAKEKIEVKDQGTAKA